MIRTLAFCFACIILGFVVSDARAGGSGYNVVIVVNQNSTNSVQLGNYYRQARNVPPQNFLRINWPISSNVEWGLSDFTTNLLNPLLTLIATQKLTNQIDYILLSMDIPYRINGGTNGYNSTTSALFYGFTPDPNYSPEFCDVAPNSSNSYAASECIFRQTPPKSANSNSWMASMLASSNDLSLGEMVINQGATSDGTFPTNQAWLLKSTEEGYNVRYSEFDNAIFNTRLRGNYNLIRLNGQDVYPASPLLGVGDGAYYFGINPTPPLVFVPGAMVDNLNSYGGMFLEYDSGEILVLAYLYAGAAGSYGTIIEPCSYPQKFPDAQNYFYQSRGFSIGECYYQSVTNPYEGLVVGEPLAAPFALPASGAWNGLSSNAVFTGTTNLSVSFTEPDALHPVQQIDLFLDGNWLETVTNVAPHTGDVLKVTINGFSTSYTVPASATIKSVSSNLVTVLNNAIYTASTKVTAYDHGDRIELQSTAGPAKLGAQIPISVSSSNSSPNLLTTFIYTTATNPANFLDSAASGIKAYEITGTVTVNSTLNLSVTKTNNAIVTLSVTNTVSGATLTQLAQQLITAISTNASLTTSDGLFGEDLETDSSGNAYFNLQPQSAGFPASQLKATITASSGISVYPPGANTMTDNINDLMPREHLYITAGVSNLTTTVSFMTTNQADGYHILAAVAYEGSHVHTQARATQSIIIKNTSLSATFTSTLSGTNTSLQPVLNFNVSANTNNIASIQLFSTGGLLAAVSNQSYAVFYINYTNLGIGVHPFYAIVTDNSGHQYRTATQSIGLIGVSYGASTLFGVDYPVTLQVTGKPPTLVWPATAGRSYNVLSTTNILSPFTLETTVTPTNSVGRFTETNPIAAEQFYRISVSP